MSPPKKDSIIQDGYIIIPARNEEKNLPLVVQGILENLNIEKDKIILVNNASKDGTETIAKNLGLKVIHEPKIGYGNACLAALTHIEKSQINPEWIIIMDADFSDDPIDLNRIFFSYKNSKFDLVIGSRLINKIEKDSMTSLQIFGNKLTCFLIQIFYKVKFTDLGSLRIIRYNSLKEMNLKDKTWGWNIEMQIRAIQKGFSILEIPVNYRKRKFGKSKISGTVFMAFKVGVKILFIFFKLVIQEKIQSYVKWKQRKL